MTGAHSGSTKLFIEGPAGRLQALWRSGGHPRDFKRAAIVCHPHPLFGGTMENKVVARTARLIAEAGIEAIRFNFRGVDQSEGQHDQGKGERDDLLAVIQHVLAVSPRARLALVGFSFGSWIALEVGVHHPAVDVLVGLAPPVRMFTFDYRNTASKPTLVVYAGNDQYTPAAATRAWIESATQPIQAVLIADVDHFFGDQLDVVASTAAAFVRDTLKEGF